MSRDNKYIASCPPHMRTFLKQEMQVESNCFESQIDHWSTFVSSFNGRYSHGFNIVNRVAVYCKILCDDKYYDDSALASSASFAEDVASLAKKEDVSKAVAVAVHLKFDEVGNIVYGHACGVLVLVSGPPNSLNLKAQYFENFREKPIPPPIIPSLGKAINGNRKAMVCHKNMFNEIDKSKDNQLCFLNSMYFCYTHLRASNVLKCKN